MGDLVRFVDSIATSPTVRLDINDEASWFVRSFSAPPPRLRRSVAQNAMRDGISVGASQYDARTLTIELELVKSTQDASATEVQKLFRELDRASNYLMYQPNNLTKPVFFRLYRSDTSQLEDVIAQAAMRRFTIELLAEPFALGLRETLGPFTVSNDPANPATNIAAPTLNTATPSTTGGTLAAGTYYYRVTALTAAGETTVSNQVSAVTTGTTSSVALAWGAVTNATGYRVYRSTAAGSNGAKVGADVLVPTVSYTDTGTAAGVAPPTVNTTGAPGCYFDVTGVIGDVAAPPVVWWTTGTAGFHLFASYYSTAPTPAVKVVQAESGSLASGTTNPGGGPDTAMSGTGTNNFVTTSFATQPALVSRVLATFNAPIRGRYHVLVAVRKSQPGDNIRIRFAEATSSVVTLRSTTNRQLIYLGVVDIFADSPDIVGLGGASNTLGNFMLSLMAERISGTGALDWDFATLIPAGDQRDTVAPPTTMIGASANFDIAGQPVIDSTRENVVTWGGGDPTLGTSTVGANTFAIIGDFPMVYPNATNRFSLFHQGVLANHLKATTMTVMVAYWPRYLFVRPAAS